MSDSKDKWTRIPESLRMAVDEVDVEALNPSAKKVFESVRSHFERLFTAQQERKVGGGALEEKRDFLLLAASKIPDNADQFALGIVCGKLFEGILSESKLVDNVSVGVQSFTKADFTTLRAVASFFTGDAANPFPNSQPSHSDTRKSEDWT